MMDDLKYYAVQSPVTDPGDQAGVWASVSPDPASIHSAITPLVFHYRGDGPFAENGIEESRVEEIDLRYVDAMLNRLHELEPIQPAAAREPRNRIVGCCRDWSVLLVSLARHHGIPARVRVGFASYFAKDWWVDHAVAEVWDAAANRWRLIDAELHPEFVSATSGERIDPLNLSAAEFLPGLDAWRTVRAGELEASRFVVHPDIPDPNLREIPYLWHNHVQDLAALNKHEMLLWDVWGIDLEPVSEEGALLLDEAAAVRSLTEWQAQFAKDAFRVPETVLSFRPNNPDPPLEVTLRK